MTQVLLVSLSKAFSDSARKASAEARRAKARTVYEQTPRVTESPMAAAHRKLKEARAAFNAAKTDEEKTKAKEHLDKMFEEAAATIRKHGIGAPK